jgi:hypothetical protein
LQEEQRQYLNQLDYRLFDYAHGLIPRRRHHAMADPPLFRDAWSRNAEAPSAIMGGMQAIREHRVEESRIRLSGIRLSWFQMLESLLFLFAVLTSVVLRGSIEDSAEMASWMQENLIQRRFEAEASAESVDPTSGLRQTLTLMTLTRPEQVLQLFFILLYNYILHYYNAII